MKGFAPPVFMPAPMEGVMRGCFCPIADAMGLIDGWLTPFWRVTSSGTPHRRKLQEFLAPFFTGPVPVFVQLLGDDPVLLADTAERMLEASPRPIAGFDLNLGCPSRAVARHPGAGGGVWQAPCTPVGILAEMRRRLGRSVLLSVKCRTGGRSPEEMLHWLPIWRDAGELDWVTIHFRTVAEDYREVPRRERRERFLAAAEALGKCPVWLNGDFATLEEAEAEMAALGGRAGGVLFGRGWLRNPGLFRGLPGPETAEEFYRRAAAWQPPIPRGQRIELGKWMLGRIIL